MHDLIRREILMKYYCRQFIQSEVGDLCACRDKTFRMFRVQQNEWKQSNNISFAILQAYINQIENG